MAASQGVLSGREPADVPWGPAWSKGWLSALCLRLRSRLSGCALQALARFRIPAGVLQGAAATGKPPRAAFAHFLQRSRGNRKGNRIYSRIYTRIYRRIPDEEEE